MSESATPVIEVCDVSKRFRLRGAGVTLKSVVIDRLKGRAAPRFDALKSISFSVHAGETLGIIGANGAGKSTLLSLIAGTIEPTSGGIRTRGTIASLLELGAGFHPDLTGRENVYLYGAIMGLSRRRMRERFEAIHAFAGIGDYLDQPVKHYSSGMYVRLGFAVAVEVDPDILLVDEVLAVGDEAFQRKCLAKMAEFRQRGKTLLIISHDLMIIRKVSDRILLLDRGEIRGLGEPDGVVTQYRDAVERDQAGATRREWGSGEIRLTALRLLDALGVPLAADAALPSGQGVRVEIDYAAATEVEDPVFGFSLADAEGRLLHGSNTQVAGRRFGPLTGQGRLSLTLPCLPLGGGVYHLSFSAHSWDHRQQFHRLDHALRFRVRHPVEFAGPLDLQSEWGTIHA